MGDLMQLGLRQISPTAFSASRISLAIRSPIIVGACAQEGDEPHSKKVFTPT
jgi:hypothetical protein